MDDYLIIDDAKAAELAQFNPGYMGWQKPGEQHLFQAPRPVGATIPRSEWKDRITAGKGTFLSDLLKQQNIPAKNQGQTPLCWSFGSTRAIETVRAVMGLAYVDLSPESVAGPCTHWRMQGGYASEAFNQIDSAGICESSFMDAPHSFSPSRWKQGWEQNALLHRSVQWYEIGKSYDEVITCLLNRIPVAAGLDYWSHLVCFLDPVILPDGTVGVLFQNSWGPDWPKQGDNGYALLTEKKATPDGAACPLIVTDR